MRRSPLALPPRAADHSHVSRVNVLPASLGYQDKHAVRTGTVLVVIIPGHLSPVLDVLQVRIHVVGILQGAGKRRQGLVLEGVGADHGGKVWVCPLTQHEVLRPAR